MYAHAYECQLYAGEFGSRHTVWEMRLKEIVISPCYLGYGFGKQLFILG